MSMIGGDLAAMDGLARRFDRAGGEFRAESQVLVRRAADALDGFTGELRRFEAAAGALDDAIGGSIARLRARADATEWTGAHRQRQEQALAAMEHDIVAVRSSIAELLGESARIVGGTLAARLGDMQRQVATAGERAETVATSFARAVAGQREAFDLVMNG
jgi:hypothetical protein